MKTPAFLQMVLAIQTKLPTSLGFSLAKTLAFGGGNPAGPSIRQQPLGVRGGKTRPVPVGMPHSNRREGNGQSCLRVSHRATGFTEDIEDEVNPGDLGARRHLNGIAAIGKTNIIRLGTGDVVIVLAPVSIT